MPHVMLGLCEFDAQREQPVRVLARSSLPPADTASNRQPEPPMIGAWLVDVLGAQVSRGPVEPTTTPGSFACETPVLGMARRIDDRCSLSRHRLGRSDSIRA